MCVLCFGLGAELDRDGLCSCSADNTEFSAESAGECVCAQTYQEDEEGECVLCFGPGAVLDGSECTCENSDTVFEDGRCVCNAEEGFLTGEDECVLCQEEIDNLN